MSEVTRLSPPISDLAKAVLKVRLDVEEIAEKWSELCACNSNQDLALAATWLQQIECQLDRLADVLNAQAEARGVEFVEWDIPGVSGGITTRSK